MKHILFILTTIILISCTGENKKEASVFFENLKEGATVSSPFKVVMGVEGMTVKPAGAIVEGTGHHHIIVDGSFIPKGTVVPNDETNIHFGKGDTETELTLSSGQHTLTLQFADGAHGSYGESMSKTISIMVE